METSTVKIIFNIGILLLVILVIIWADLYQKYRVRKAKEKYIQDYWKEYEDKRP